MKRHFSFFFLTLLNMKHSLLQFCFVQFVEVCAISLLTSLVSFGLPMLRKCSPCPKSDANSNIECPRPPGTYGNFVNVSF